MLRTLTERVRDAVPRQSIRLLLALLLALTYIAFQVEPSENEYEANHPSPLAQCSFTAIPRAAECDKENAQEAFIPIADYSIEIIITIPVEPPAEIVRIPSVHGIRDKSPPVLPIHISHL